MPDQFQANSTRPPKTCGAVVPPEVIGDYIRELRKLFNKHDYSVSI